ncbi:hypothetical protein BH23GEM5_BH23GEM5_20900 [soil metagenome]
MAVTQRQATEHLLENSEAQFRTLVDHAPVMVWKAGTNTLCTFFNKTWLDFTGRSLEQEQGNGWISGVHSEDYQSCRDSYLTSFRARRPFTMECRLRRHDGEYRWLLDNGVPLYDVYGIFSGYIGSCVDITARRQSEDLHAQLLAAEQKARAQAEASARWAQLLNEASRGFSSSRDPNAPLVDIARIAVPALADFCAVDLVGEDNKVRRLEVAHADPDKRSLALELLHFPPEHDWPGGVATAIHSGDPVLVPAISETALQAAVHGPEHLRAVRELDLSSLLIVPLAARNRTFGAIMLAMSRAAGRRFDKTDVERAGELAHLVALALDNAQLFSRIEASEERFRATFERAAVGIAHVSPEGKWIRVNQRLCEITGFSREELLAKTFQDITHPEDLANDLVQMHALLAGEIETHSMEKRYIRRDGMPVWINLTVSLIRHSSGEPSHFVAVVQDIQLQKQALHMRDEVLSLVLHDLRSPLGAISMGASFLLDVPLPEEQRNTHLRIIQRAADRMNRLIQSLTSGS